jgi:hypothetical protein
MDRIDIERPETPQEKLQYIQAIREQEMAHFMAATDGSVALTADTLEDVQVSGFEPHKGTIKVIITDNSGDYSFKQIQEDMGKRTRGIMPLIVGRYTWRLGFAAETHDGGIMLLAVMNEEDSEDVRETLTDIGHIYLEYRSNGQDLLQRLDTDDQTEYMGRLIGGEIEIEYLVNNLMTGHLEHIPS